MITEKLNTRQSGMTIIDASKKFPAQTGLIWIDCEQGSNEWFQARLGVPSASQFKRIVDTKGNWSRSAMAYCDELVGEIVTRKTAKKSRLPVAPEDNDLKNPFYWADRGIWMEDEARNHYMAITGNEVKQAGFGINQPIGVGCSPDGLIGNDGGLEIKCPSAAVHNGYLRDQRIPPKYYQQVMGSLLVTGRKWWDFFSYHPDFSRQLMIRVERNEEYLEKMEEQLTKATGIIALEAQQNGGENYAKGH